MGGQGWGSAHLDQVGGDKLWLGLTVLQEPPHAFHPGLVVFGLQQPRQLPKMLRHPEAAAHGGAKPRQPRAIGAEPVWKGLLTWAAAEDGCTSCPMPRPQTGETETRVLPAA